MPPLPDPAGHTLGSWLDGLARPVPAPGGGAAAAVVLAHAAALVEMVLGYTAPGPERDAHLAEASAVRAAALVDAADDAAASAGLAAAFRRPSHDPGRADAVAAALTAASGCSIRIVETARRLEPALAWSARHGEPRVRADAEVAAVLLAAAVRATTVNIRGNAGADPGPAATLALCFAARLDALAAGVGRTDTPRPGTG